MSAQVDALSDNQAVAALRLVAQYWLKADGIAAFGVSSDARDYINERSLEVPGWVTGDPPSPQTMPAAEFKEIGSYCRTALSTLLESDDPHAHGWADQAINKVTEAQPQILETILLIKGAIMIGMLLAARVEKIDKTGVTFYQGVPKGLGTVLSAAGKFFGGS